MANTNLIDPNVMLHQARVASNPMKSLSSETRLMILCMLSSGELSVTQMEERLQIVQATLSRQLARLRIEKLVAPRRALDLLLHCRHACIRSCYFTLSALLQY